MTIQRTNKAAKPFCNYLFLCPIFQMSCFKGNFLRGNKTIWLNLLVVIFLKIKRQWKTHKILYHQYKPKPKPNQHYFSPPILGGKMEPERPCLGNPPWVSVTDLFKCKRIQEHGTMHDTVLSSGAKTVTLQDRNQKQSNDSSILSKQHSAWGKVQWMS